MRMSCCVSEEKFYSLLKVTRHSLIIVTLKGNTTFHVKELSLEFSGKAEKIIQKVHRTGWIVGLTDLMAFLCLVANDMQISGEVPWVALDSSHFKYIDSGGTANK
jgi:hypothetical protein